MTAPDLARLLKDDGPAGTVARAYLVGLRAALLDGLSTLDGLGRTAAAAACRDIDRLVDGPPTPDPATEPPGERAVEPAAARMGVEPVAAQPVPAQVAAVSSLRLAADEVDAGAVTDVPIPDDFQSVLDSATAPDGFVGQFAEACAQLLAIGAHDPDLVDYLPTAVGAAARRPARPEDLAALRADLLLRLGACAVVADPVTRLLRVLDLAEALSSCRHVPPPHPASWWARWYHRVEDLVYEAARPVPDVQLTVLTGSYRTINDLTAHDAPVPGERGRVYGCLRLWARIDGRVHPGRVLVGA